MRTLTRISLIGVSVLSAHGAIAQSVDASDPQPLVEIIQDLGYRGKLEVDGIGDPMIHSSVGGTEFAIYFYGCEDNAKCTALLFKVGYDLADGTTLGVVNDWNAANLFGRAYLDDEADPWIEMPVNLHGGVSRQNFEDTFDWWEVLIDNFEAHIDL